MIDASINAALGGVVQYGARIALMSSGEPSTGQEGLFLCAENGGPANETEPFHLTGRLLIGLWERWMIHRGD
jgi:hypothetical protein